MTSTQKHALVLASSRGIGFACALALAEDGMSVTLNGRDAAQLKKAQLEIRERVPGAVVNAVMADLTDEAQRSALLEACSHVDVLVLNVGGPTARPGGVYSVEEWRNEFETLLIPMVDMLDRVLPAMSKKGWGRVVAISSTSIKQPITSLVASGVFRSGIANLLASRAQAVAPNGVTINSILPGRILTDRQKNALQRDAANKKVDLQTHINDVAQTIPMARLGLPEEIGAACSFFCSDKAAYVTGQSLVVDGGAYKGIV
jgi:3-oxoacyl-[acyl-carrier protein] reductase